jgi:S-adenosylmethionine hydrolase
VSPRPVTFLSDYGTDDEFAGVCRAVIARIAPEVAVIDLTHGVRPHAVLEGAAILANSLPYCPPGVHLAVVDPGVGSTRRALAVRASFEDRVLVGPDNGLLWPAIQRLGGATQAMDVSGSPVRLEPVSATFHGRDIFAPVAAHLAVGVPMSELGEEVSPDSLASVPAWEPEISSDHVACHVVSMDRFGNIALDLADRQLPSTGLGRGKPLAVEAGGGDHEARFERTFADAKEGELILYVDSYASLALAVNRGSAAERLGVAPGDRLVLRPVER